MSEFKTDDVVVHPKYGRGIVVGGTHVVLTGTTGELSDIVCLSLSQVAPDLRRLVGIDPEDREEVERVARRIADTGVAMNWDDRTFANQQRAINGLAAALREFANPKPPKPEEPTGLGAVVEDVSGDRWVRAGSAIEPVWWCAPAAERKSYAEIDAVSVLSEGVQP